jgi:hypothetical protein
MIDREAQAAKNNGRRSFFNLDYLSMAREEGRVLPRIENAPCRLDGSLD